MNEIGLQIRKSLQSKLKIQSKRRAKRCCGRSKLKLTNLKLKLRKY